MATTTKASFAAVLLLNTAATAMNNGLARTPQMGWACDRRYKNPQI